MTRKPKLPLSAAGMILPSGRVNWSVDVDPAEIG